MKSWVIVSTAFLLTCCTAWAGDGRQAPLDVSYCQLAKDPSAWTGKRIRVRAIYHYGFEFFVVGKEGRKYGWRLDPGMTGAPKDFFTNSTKWEWGTRLSFS